MNKLKIIKEDKWIVYDDDKKVGEANTKADAIERANEYLGTKINQLGNKAEYEFEI